MDIGTEWLVEAAGCRAATLQSVEMLRALFTRVIADLGLKPVHDGTWYVFPEPGGVTGFVMLTESHLACHTYPEHGVAAINLYCCRERAEWPWREQLMEMLGATEVRVRKLTRSMPQAAPDATTALYDSIAASEPGRQAVEHSTSSGVASTSRHRTGAALHNAAVGVIGAPRINAEAPGANREGKETA